MSNPPLWMPGALRIESERRNTLNGNGFRLLTWHTFEARYSLTVEAALRYLIYKGSEAFVFHPIAGEWGQCQPMNTAARTLRSTTAQPTNRFGTVHQQVEVIAYAAKPWTDDLTPAGREGLQRGLDFFRAWGIPDQWAWKNQPPPPYPGGSVRRRAPEQSGHAYHSGWYVNDHGDPGAIAAPWTLAPPALPATPAPMSEEDELMALTVKNPVTGKQWPAASALWSIWHYAIAARDTAIEAREIAAAVADKQLSEADLDRIASRVAAALKEQPADAPVPDDPTESGDGYTSGVSKDD